jgi:hypothetical protein
MSAKYYIVPVIMIAGLSMGNSSCQQQQGESGRYLKMDAEVGLITAAPVLLPNGTTVDFPYVANALFYREVMNDDHFVIIGALPVVPPMSSAVSPAPASVSMSAKSVKASSPGSLSDKDTQLLIKYAAPDSGSSSSATGNMLSEKLSAQDAASSSGSMDPVMPACLYTKPQVHLDGNVFNFQLTYGGGLSIGFTNSGGQLAQTGGALGGIGVSVAFTNMSLDMGFNAKNPLRVDAAPMFISDPVGSSISIKAGLDIPVYGVPVGLDFMYQSDIVDVIRSTMDDGLSSIVNNWKMQPSYAGQWNNLWESRVLYQPKLVDNDTTVIIRGGGESLMMVGDSFNIYNMDYLWQGEPCATDLVASIPQTALTDPFATATVLVVGDNISVLKLTPLKDGAVQPGALVKISKLMPLATTKTSSSSSSGN